MPIVPKGNCIGPMSNPIALPTAQSAQPVPFPPKARRSRTIRPRLAPDSGVNVQAKHPISIGTLIRGQTAGNASLLAHNERGEWTAARQAKARDLILRIETLVETLLDAYAKALASGTVKPETLPLACGILLSKRDNLNIELGNAAVTQANRVLAPSDVLLALQALARGTVAQSAPIIAHNIDCVSSAQVVDAQEIPQSAPGGGGSSLARE